MKEKKLKIFQSPDLNLLQGVIVDFKTRIYIPIGADPIITGIVKACYLKN